MKRIIITGLIVMMFILSGCGTMTGGSNKDKIEEVDYRDGTDGLVFEFLDGYPPKEVLAESNIVASVELSNEGASDIKDGKIVLGYEADYIDFLSWGRQGIDFQGETGSKGTFSLRGKSIYDPKGETGTLTINLMADRLEEQTETHTTSLTVTTCYGYSTIFSSAACIDTDVYNVKEAEKVCDVQDISGGSQGAPVVISDIKVSMLPHALDDMIKPQFQITILNRGKGEVIDREKVEDVCSAKPVAFDELNIVDINVTLSQEPLLCTPEKVTLRKGEAIVRCEYIEGIPKSRGTYLAPLVVKLDYGYTQSTSTDIEIRSIPS